MTISRLPSLFAACLFIAIPWRGAGQTANAAQQVPLLGLRSSAGHGSFPAAAFGPDGAAYLLYDQGDGVRILKSDAIGSAVAAQAYVGAAGDAPVALCIDPAGNVYVSGTSTSNMLRGTSGAAYPSPADTSTNSFVAKYDANLNLIFLTFLGSGRTVVTGIAATADAVFVTGITFNAAFPVTPAAIQQAPALNSTENGFAERFSPDGKTLVYATYITGANGDTMPATLVADSTDSAYIAGATSASGLPTLNALEPQIILASGSSTSGFLSKLTSAGDGFVFSTFLAGSGVTGMALDANPASLLLSGNFSLGGFPVANAALPLTADAYQELVRMPLDGSNVTSSTVLFPSTQSFVSTDGSGGAWVSGKLGTPAFPATAAPAYSLGDSFLLHLNASNAIDRTFRFGGAPVANASYATLTSTVAAPAIKGSSVLLPGTLTVSSSASLLATQHFDLALSPPTTLLPNSIHDALPSTASCTSGASCSGTAAFLAGISTVDGASLAVSTDDLPNVTLRNLGSTTAMGLTITASGYNVATNCGTSLPASGQCAVMLSGGGPGTLTITATNATTIALALPATSATPNPLALSSAELDFGVAAAVSSAVTRTLTVTNLTTAVQTFTAAKDAGASTAATFALATSTCAPAVAASTCTLASGTSCSLTFSLTAASNSSGDGPALSAWKIGGRDVLLSGYSQAAALSLSATALDFGAQFNASTAIQLPRYLFLSNHGDAAVQHTALVLPPASPFTVTDECPSSLPGHSLCRITVRYKAATAPSSDALNVTLDAGLAVLLKGRSLAPAAANGSTSNPSLTLSTGTLAFASPVIVTGVSSTTSNVVVRNTGGTALPLTIAISGDFALTNGCPASLGAGASCTLLVAFTPSQPGLDQGLLSVTAGSTFSPGYVNLSGTGIALLTARNGVLPLGQTLAGEPIVAWYKVQQPISSLTVTSNSAAFGVALVQDTGYGHGTLPASSFSTTVTSGCANCWLGVQFLSPTPGSQAAAITLTTVSAGKPYVLTATAAALAVQGILLTPVQQDFGTLDIHSSSPSFTFTLANLLDAGSALTVQSVTATGDFSVVPNQSGGPSCTGILASTASCFIQVTFSPTALGQRTGVLTVVTDAGTVTSVLSGFGEPDPGIALTPASLVFSNVPGTVSTMQTVTLSNTGTSPVTVGTVTSSAPFAFQSNCSTLPAGSTCTVTVTYTSQFADVSGALTIPVTTTVNGQSLATTYAVPLAGNYTTADAGLEILPSEVNFGAGPVNSVGETRLFTLNNLSGKALNVTFQMPRQFVASASAACPTLAAGASCSFPVTFLPATAGSLTGTVFAQGTSSDGTTNVQALAYMLGYGRSSATLAISGPIIPNSPLSFGQLASGQTSQRVLTLTNNGSAPLTIRRVLSEPPFFAATTCGPALAPGASCTVTLTYAPVDEIATGSSATASRTDSGTLVVESDALSSPDTIPLSGSATPAISSTPASSAILATYTLSQGSLTFANTTVGNVSASQTVSLVNTGTTTIHLLKTIVPADFAVATGCSVVLPGAACTFSVSFTPGSASAANIRSGTLELLTDAGDTLEFVSLLGSSTAAPLTLSPTAISFGTVSVSSSSSQQVVVTNNSSAPVTFTGLSITGDYAVSSLTCPANGSTLAAGASCTLQVTFTPSTTGTSTGTLSVATDSTQQPLTVSLTGDSIQAHLQISPGALTFGNVSQGAAASLTITLSNTGTANVSTITSQITGMNAGDFAVTVPCAVAALAPGQSCNETVTFTPSAMTNRSATLTITSTDASSPALVPLSGTGVAAGTFTLTVNGGSAASVTVAGGNAATFSLAVTPANGYTGAVALTCTPVTAAPHAACSLLSSTLTVQGTAAQTSTATITTIASALNVGVGAMLLLPLALMRKRKWAMAQAVTVILVLGLFVSLTTTGCGSGTTVVSGGGGTGTTVLKTPAGTYQYKVTASSINGSVVSSTVTLNLIVQ